ncbi:hypothetical protein MMC34_004298 [Xylographa carneopallida]|nr:hypothetical protein [Xylographa carneopallida]
MFASELFGSFKDRAAAHHGRWPGICKIPLPVIGIISLVALVNIVVWIAVGAVLHYHVYAVALRAVDGSLARLTDCSDDSALVSTAVLAYTLGLRHALDADHISAIDLMTRRLVASGGRPVTVGTFFSLGHSTIVVITSIVVAATASAISSKFGTFSTIGGIIGSSVSAAFLIILGLMNVYIMYKLIQQMKILIDSSVEEEQAFKIKGAGCLFWLFKKMFKIIDRPWKMYPLGVMFGLGFDTSSEVALLGIASIQASKGTSIWLILIFPVLFTGKSTLSGMCLLDTLDGALMLTLYTSPSLAKDTIAILYYSIVLTGITVVVALVIGTIQLLTLILNIANLTGKFWAGVQVAGDNYDIIGGGICASFLVFGALSVLLYKPWRRRIDRRRSARRQLTPDRTIEAAELEASSKQVGTISSSGPIGAHPSLFEELPCDPPVVIDTVGEV